MLIDRYGVPAVLGERADYFRLKRIAYLSNVVAAVRAMRSAVGNQIHRIPDTYLSILDDLMRRDLWR